MACEILPNCTACGDCAQICPNYAIFQAGSLFQISPYLCTECVGYADAPQCAAVCPVDAIGWADEPVMVPIQTRLVPAPAISSATCE